jgi:cysteine-rich repeat protein
VCGNGIINLSEQCDDGNTVSGDGCSATCTIESSALAIAPPTPPTLLETGPVGSGNSAGSGTGGSTGGASST